MNIAQKITLKKSNKIISSYIINEKISLDIIVITVLRLDITTNNKYLLIDNYNTETKQSFGDYVKIKDFESSLGIKVDF